MDAHLKAQHLALFEEIIQHELVRELRIEVVADHFSAIGLHIAIVSELLKGHQVF